MQQNHVGMLDANLIEPIPDHVVMRAFKGWLRPSVGMAIVMACEATSCSLSGKVFSQARISGGVRSVIALM
jgi:hypothetical protein